MPAELGPVLKQLRSALSYTNYALMDTLLLRTRSGEDVGTSGTLAPLQESKGSSYDFRCRPSIQTGQAGRVIRIDNIRFGALIQGVGSSTITANADVKEGQKVVIGKTSVEGSDRALILVLSAKIVD